MVVVAFVVAVTTFSNSRPTAGATTTNDIVLDGSDLIFEGALANAFETTLTAQEPTQDNTISLPNQSGVVAMDGDALAYAIVFGG